MRLIPECYSFACLSAGGAFFYAALFSKYLGVVWAWGSDPVKLFFHSSSIRSIYASRSLSADLTVATASVRLSSFPFVSPFLPMSTLYCFLSFSILISHCLWMDAVFFPIVPSCLSFCRPKTTHLSDTSFLSFSVASLAVRVVIVLTAAKLVVFFTFPLLCPLLDIRRIFLKP